jgi:hypothetical protein
LYSINIATNIAHGSISPDGDLELPYQSNKVIRFLPDAGYRLEAAYLNGQPIVTYNNVYTLHVTEDATITATFKIDNDDKIITATAGANGTIDPIGDVFVPLNGSQKFTFMPDANYKVDTVLVDGYPVSFTNNSYEFTNVLANHTISVTFKALPEYIITASASANGTISPIGEINVLEGKDIDFTFTPNTYYVVDSIIINGNAQEYHNNTYKLENVQANGTFHVVFVLGTGINDNTIQLIAITPNPSTGIFSISHDGIDIDRIEVLNVTGSVTMEIENVSDMIDMSKLPNGTYTIIFHYGNGAEYHQVVKIQ